MKKLSQLLIIFTLILGLNILSSRTFKVSAANTMVDVYITSLEVLDGTYTVYIGDETSIIENNTNIYRCESGLINQSYLYLNDRNELKMNIVNGNQININNMINLSDISNGLFYFIYIEDDDIVEIFDLKEHIWYQVNGSDLTAQLLMKCYYLSPGSRVYAFLYIEQSVVKDISDPLTFFNMMTTDYHLFFATVQIDYNSFYVFDDASEDLFILEFASDQVIPFYPGYILFNYELQKYALFDDEQIDSLLLDVIENQFEKTIYTPSIIDVLDDIFNEVDASVKEITMGPESLNDDPNGLYVVGQDNKLYKIVNYEFLETIQGNIFIRNYMFYPRMAYQTFDDVNLNLVNVADDYMVSEENFIRVYGQDEYFLKSETYDQLAFFLDGNQIDISQMNVSEILWIYDAFRNHVFTTNIDYNQMFDGTVPSTFTIVENYEEVPDGDGFVKIVSNDNYFDAYFYTNNQYYKYVNMDLIDQLSADISSYKITFHKLEESLIIDFENSDEHVYWDVLKEEYSKNFNVFVTGEKEFTYDQSGIFMLSYLHFNLNIMPDLIETITFNYFTHKESYLAGIKTGSTEQTNLTKTIKAYDYTELEASNLWAFLFKLAIGSNIDQTIKASSLENYDWQVLLSMDCNTEWYSSPASNVLGITSVQRIYDDVVLMHITYWMNGEFHEDVIIDDFPNDDESPSNIVMTIIKNAIDNVVNQIKSFAQKNAGWFWLIVGILVLITIAPLFNRRRRWYR